MIPPVAVALFVVAVIEFSWKFVSKALFGDDDDDPPFGFA